MWRHLLAFYLVAKLHHNATLNAGCEETCNKSSHNPWGNRNNYSNLFKVHMTRKISHFKNTLIWKGFKSRVKWHFSFCDIFFCPRDTVFNFSYYANLIISCASKVVRHKIKNISANNEAMLFKLGRDVAPYKIYQMIHILMLLWQHAQF